MKNIISAVLSLLIVFGTAAGSIYFAAVTGDGLYSGLGLYTSVSYETAEKSADGKISDADAYIKAKYGSGWTLERENSLPMEGYNQLDLSCYSKNVEGGVASEGNCWLVAAYTVLQYYADNGMEAMPGSTAIKCYRPSKAEPVIYSSYYDAKGNNISGKITVNGRSVNKYQLISRSFVFPELWTAVRKYADSQYGRIEGGTVNDTAEVIKNVAALYGSFISTAVSSAKRLSYTKLVRAVDSGDAFVLVSADSASSGHAMAACGYRLYSRTVGFWIFKVTEHKMLIELRDGYTCEPVYYDFSACGGRDSIVLCTAKKLFYV